MNLRRWLHEHSLKLLAIRDTPEAIAGGVAIGMFFGFTPLFGLKTLSAILFAWLTRSNIIAAVIAGTMHDVILPFMPVIYRWEYDIGYWLLSHPHRLPRHISKSGWRVQQWGNWPMFWLLIKPVLLGSVICGTPFAIASFVVTRFIMSRHQRKKRAAAPPEPGANA